MKYRFWWVFMSLVNTPLVFSQDYTIENTYQKYLKKYPDISLPDLNIPENIHVDKDRIYKTIDGIELRLDIYRLLDETLNSPRHTPSNKDIRVQAANNKPVIMLIHGGGWRVGDKTLMQPLALGLAKKGYIVATPNYRLSGQAKFPAAIDDLFTALQWLKVATNNANIVLAGCSAGGQLAALLAYSGGQVKLTQQQVNFAPHDKTTIKSISALINIDGLSDFTSPEALPFENDPNKKVTSASAWLGGRYEDIPDIWQAASPIFYISEQAPKTLFINSSRVRFSAGKAAAQERLSTFGVLSDDVYLDNSPHSFWLLNPWIEPTVNSIDKFLINNNKNATKALEN